MGRIVGWVRPEEVEQPTAEPAEVTAVESEQAEAEQAEADPEGPAEKKRKPARKEQE